MKCCVYYSTTQQRARAVLTSQYIRSMHVAAAAFRTHRLVGVSFFFYDFKLTAGLLVWFVSCFLLACVQLVSIFVDFNVQLLHRGKKTFLDRRVSSQFNDTLNTKRLRNST